MASGPTLSVNGFQQDKQAIQGRPVTAADNHMPERNLRPSLNYIKKINSKWNSVFNIKRKAIKLLEENIGENSVMVRQRFV